MPPCPAGPLFHAAANLSGLALLEAPPPPQPFGAAAASLLPDAGLRTPLQELPAPGGFVGPSFSSFAQRSPHYSTAGGLFPSAAEPWGLQHQHPAAASPLRPLGGGLFF